MEKIGLLDSVCIEGASVSQRKDERELSPSHLNSRNLKTDKEIPFAEGKTDDEGQIAARTTNQEIQAVKYKCDKNIDFANKIAGHKVKNSIILYFVCWYGYPSDDAQSNHKKIFQSPFSQGIVNNEHFFFAPPTKIQMSHIKR